MIDWVPLIITKIFIVFAISIKVNISIFASYFYFFGGEFLKCQLVSYKYLALTKCIYFENNTHKS